MKKQYTKKQIQEAINYWSKRLDEMETFELLENILNEQFSKKQLLSESEKSSIIQSVKNKIEQNLKDEKDVKKFVKDNDRLVQTKCKSSIFKKIWNALKVALKAGLTGLNFILKHWRIIIMVGIIVSIMKYGFWGIVEKLISMIIKFFNIDDFINAVKQFGVDYAAAADKISNTSIEAGGYGGLSGAGLGGGLR